MTVLVATVLVITVMTAALKLKRGKNQSKDLGVYALKCTDSLGNGLDVGVICSGRDDISVDKLVKKNRIGNDIYGRGIYDNVVKVFLTFTQELGHSGRSDKLSGVDVATAGGKYGKIMLGNALEVGSLINAGEVFAAGAEALVAGSAVFGAADPEAEIVRMLEA